LYIVTKGPPNPSSISSLYPLTGSCLLADWDQESVIVD